MTTLGKKVYRNEFFIDLISDQRITFDEQRSTIFPDFHRMTNRRPNHKTGGVDQIPWYEDFLHESFDRYTIYDIDDCEVGMKIYKINNFIYLEIMFSQAEICEESKNILINFINQLIPRFKFMISQTPWKWMDLKSEYHDYVHTYTALHVNVGDEIDRGSHYTLIDALKSNLTFPFMEALRLPKYHENFTKIHFFIEGNVEENLNFLLSIPIDRTEAKMPDLTGSYSIFPEDTRVEIGNTVIRGWDDNKMILPAVEGMNVDDLVTLIMFVNHYSLVHITEFGINFEWKCLESDFRHLDHVYRNALYQDNDLIDPERLPTYLVTILEFRQRKDSRIPFGKW